MIEMLPLLFSTAPLL